MLKPQHGHVVVAVVDGEFTVKYLHHRAGRLRLRAANPTFPDIIPKDGQTIEVWGGLGVSDEDLREVQPIDGEVLSRRRKARPHRRYGGQAAPAIPPR